MGNLIDITWFYVLLLASAGICGYLLTQLQGYRQFNPEGKIFIKARKEGKPILEVENIANGHAWYLLGEKDQDGDPIFDLDSTGMKVDPSMCTGDAEPSRHGNGLNIWHYATSKSLPMSTMSALAYKTMTAHRYETVVGRHLAFLTNNELYSLMRSPRENLKHDARLFLEKYRPTRLKLVDSETDVDLTLTEFVSELTTMQDMFAALPVETGFFCYFKAFKDLPYAHSSQDIERIKYLFEQKAWEQWETKFKMMQYVIMVIMLIAASSVFIFVLSMVAGKK
jgi:hypothetical protein